jgi:hypothetical protein
VADQLLWSSFRRLRRQGTPYRDHLPDHDAFDLGAEISAAARARIGDRLAAQHAVAPPSAWRFPSSPRSRSLALTLRIIMTVVSCAALGWYATWSPDPPAPAPHAATEARPPGPAPVLEPEQLATRPLGRYGLVVCDFVQNSSKGPLEIVTLCGVGGRILAVAGGGVEGDASRVVRGRIEPIPDGNQRAQAWAMMLRHQVERDRSYYDFYLKRDGAAPQDHWAVVDDEARARELAGQQAAAAASTARLRRLALSPPLALLASWFVWLQLSMIRRRTRWLAALYKTAA